MKKKKKTPEEILIRDLSRRIKNLRGELEGCAAYLEDWSRTNQEVKWLYDQIELALEKDAE